MILTIFQQGPACGIARRTKTFSHNPHKQYHLLSYRSPIRRRALKRILKTIDDVPDLHGDIVNPQLVIFFAGNQFMVVPELTKAFKEASHEQNTSQKLRKRPLQIWNLQRFSRQIGVFTLYPPKLKRFKQIDMFATDELGGCYLQGAEMGLAILGNKQAIPLGPGYLGARAAPRSPILEGA